MSVISSAKAFAIRDLMGLSTAFYMNSKVIQGAKKARNYGLLFIIRILSIPTFFHDGDNRARTCDLSRVRRTLSQLSYASMCKLRYGIYP